LVAPAQAQGNLFAVPLRGLAKSEEAADGVAVGGEKDGDARINHCVTHNGGQYITSFPRQSKGEALIFLLMLRVQPCVYTWKQSRKSEEGRNFSMQT